MGSRPLWLITKQGLSGLEVLTTGGYTLPVFSFREEAEVFLHFVEGARDGWQARETTCGELVSILYGPCGDAERVSLDSLPKIAELMSFSRKVFVEALLASEVPSAVEESEMLVVAS